MNTLQKIKNNAYVRKNKGLLGAIVLLILILLLMASSMFGINPITQSQSYNYIQQEDQSRGFISADSVEKGYVLSSKPGVSESIGYPEPPYVPGGEGEYDKDEERKLIKNGSLTLVVQNIGQSRQTIELEARKLGGFVSQANFSEEGIRPQNNAYTDIREHVTRSGYLTIRIPENKFIEAMTAFKKQALVVQNENVSSSDVTEQYADLETRITNKKAEESQYRLLLTKATKIEDILQITQYLNKTRSEIEQMEGQLNRLSNQVTLSTVTVYLTAEEDIEIFGVVWSPWQEIQSAFQNLLQDLVGLLNLIIRFIFALPVLILYALVYGLVIGLLLLGAYKVGSVVYRKVKK